MNSKTYEYIRVSSKDQNEGRQRIAMCEAGVPVNNIVMDKQSGKDFDRPGYRHLLRKLKPDDILVIKSIDRLGRSIKPFVMGRKNWLFANTPAGAQSSAVVYSLIETAKEKELDPYRYMLWVLRCAPSLSQTDELWAEKLTPNYAPPECKIPK